MTQILDGRSLAQSMRAELHTEVQKLLAETGTLPCLAIVMAAAEAETTQYVRSLRKAALEVGIDTQIIKITDPSLVAINQAIAALAEDEAIHGIILQTPLPNKINSDDVFPLIPVHKDVDGVNPLSAGRLVNGLPAFAPATAEAVITILKHYKVPLEGAHAVVIGRSRIVGKPTADLLLSANATVTICHTKTKDLTSITRTADIIVAAAGQADLLTTQHITKKTVVVDVGTNISVDGAVTGDAAFDDMQHMVRAITPVPGGVGPVTTAVLLAHTLHAAKGEYL